MELVRVTSAKYVSGHTLLIGFDDGVSAEIDFSSWINRYPFFSELRDISYFKKFEADGWTVSWPNGADIAPETLHAIAVKQSSLQPA